MPRYAAKKDGNHHEIALGLQADGWSVMDISRAGGGIPDIAVGKRGIAVFIEIKSDDKAQLTPAEKRVKDNWDGPYIIAVSLEDARSQLAKLTQG